MEKTAIIKGMSCSHCAARVEKALNKIDGVEAKVDLENRSAKLILTKEVSDKKIKEAVEAIDYEVTDILD
ncbi:MAG TPA: heavy metal-associated domain-containing protein [Paludibacteraceae bacterium]|nr:heavy metal-associated domain-containing protein [Paludibacteraceae bacterium]HPT43245.1 heavy metal-associated domain-containing protein [Paludibacteraceae bacterium]